MDAACVVVDVVDIAAPFIEPNTDVVVPSYEYEVAALHLANDERDPFRFVVNPVDPSDWK